MRVLMLTGVWPTPDHPERAPFIVRQAEFLRRGGIDLDVFAVNGRSSPLAYSRAWLNVHRLLARKSYDVIHAQWAQAALPTIPSRIPLVVTFRGSDVEGVKDCNGRQTTSGRILQKIARRVARSATEAIVVAQRLTLLLPRRKYHVIPSGLDLELFQPCPQAQAQACLGLPGGRKYVLFAASPANPVKRFALAEEVVKRLPAKYCAELVIANGLAPNQMPLYMNACDILLLTSRHEGSPNVVKEALACNLPVLSTDVGDVRERVIGLGGCIVSRSDDPGELAAGAAAILDRSQRIQGRPAVADLNESVLTPKVIAVYEQALTAHKF